jgi:hypothetical protein
MGCLTAVIIIAFFTGALSFKGFVVMMLICMALMIGDDD